MKNDPDSPVFSDAFLIEHKMNYIKKEGEYKSRAQYEDQTRELCTICSIIMKDPNVPSYEVYRTDTFIAFLNLFPYTSGHLLISPIEHYEEYEEMPDIIIEGLSLEIKKAIKLVKTATKTTSVNIGWNQGPHAGGSIKHFHVHIVPRFPRELNFIEIIAHSRPMIMSLEKVQQLYQNVLAALDK